VLDYGYRKACKRCLAPAYKPCIQKDSRGRETERKTPHRERWVSDAFQSRGPGKTAPKQA